MSNPPSHLLRSTEFDNRALSWNCAALTNESYAALENDWESLAISASEKNIFQFPWFVRNSMALLGALNSKIVTIRYDAVLIGILILRRDTGYGKLPIPFWRSALHHEQYLGTPLVRANYESAFAAGLCAWLDNAPKSCCFVKLSQMSADGAIARAIARHCTSDARQILASNRHHRAAIVPRGRCGASADDLLSTKRRKSIRRSMNRLAKEGDVSFEKLTDAAQLDDWTAQFLAMENTGWKRENGSSILSCEHETALYRAIIDEAFQARNLHFSRLCLDRVPIAYTLDIVSSPTAYCLKSAIDQRFRRFSPGVLMEYETLKHYDAHDHLTLVDSCSAHDNRLLNELWPDRKGIVDLAIARKGAGYGAIFHTIRVIKSLLAPASKA